MRQTFLGKGKREARNASRRAFGAEYEANLHNARPHPLRFFFPLSDSVLSGSAGVAGKPHAHESAQMEDLEYHAHSLEQVMLRPSESWTLPSRGVTTAQSDGAMSAIGEARGSYAHGKGQA